MSKDQDKEDQALFRASVKGVKRLQQRTPPPRKARIPPTPRKRPHDETRAPADDYVPETAVGMEVDGELDYSRPGLQHGVMRKLRRGQFPVDTELDLHGMTATIARRELYAFLERCRTAAARCVLIIHGKGLSTPDRRPVLKSGVNAWLRQRDDVLAFCSARPRDGGTGALYVLLRKQS